MWRYFLRWKTLGHARRFGTESVNYADDFGICGQAPASAMRSVVERMMERLRLPLNATKARCLRLPEEPQEFLGYRVGRNHNPRRGGLHRHAPEPGERVQCLLQDQCADGSAVRAAARAGGGGMPEPSAARLGELLLSGADDAVDAPAAVWKA